MSSGDDKRPPDNKGEKGEKAQQDDDSEGGLLPAILVGAGLLAVVALLLFGGGDDDEAGKGKDGQDKAAAAQGAARGGGAAGGGAQGGVAARPIDAPSRKAAPGSARINPAVKPVGMGMAPQGIPQRDDKPPEGASTDELINWYEKKLTVAQRMLESRQTFKDRLPQIQERIENSDSPERDKQLEAFEGRKKLVEKNYETAKQKVEDIEAKLVELRGEG